jgi:hypothetical protein
MSFDVWSKKASELLIIPDRLRNIYHEAAMNKTQIFFWVGRFGKGEKIFAMKRGAKDHLARVSMKFSLIASGGTHIEQLADL